MASASAALQIKPTPLIDLEAGQPTPSGTIVFGSNRASFIGSSKIHPGGSGEVELTNKPTDNDASTVDDKGTTGGGNGGDQPKVDEKKEDQTDAATVVDGKSGGGAAESPTKEEEKKEEKKEEPGKEKTKEEEEEEKKKAEEAKAAEEKKKKEDDEKKKKKEDEEKKKKEEKASFLRVVRNGAIGAAVFVAFYIFLIQMAIKQTLSAAEAPVSRGNDYSASNAGWEVTYFSNPQFVDKPSVLSGRLSTGANVKLLDHLRLEVFFTGFNPGASGGTAGVQLTVVLPPSWKDENKPPKPWFNIVCQFGNAVIQINPATFNPSQYVQLLPNGGLQLTYGSNNAYPFDTYRTDAGAWCYYDATLANKLAPTPPTKPPVYNPKLAPTKFPTIVPNCWPTDGTAWTASPQPFNDACCLNLYNINNPVFGTYAVNITQNFHKFGCCSGLDVCCAAPTGADDDSVSNQAGGPISAGCIAATNDPTNPSPSPCDPSAGAYNRQSCAVYLWPGPKGNVRKLTGHMARFNTDNDNSKKSSIPSSSFDYVDSYGEMSVGGEINEQYDGDIDVGRDLLVSQTYTPIAPLFSPATGYLNFELAVQTSDAGLFKHSQFYDALSISQIQSTYSPGGGQPLVSIVYNSINFPKVSVLFTRAPINKVFAMYILVAMWFVCAAHTSANWTFYFGMKKVDAAALVTGAVTVLFALPAIRNSMPGAPPIGAIIDFAAYFWCIIICIMHVLCMSWLWLDNTFLNPQPKPAVKPSKVFVTTEAEEKKKEEEEKEKKKKKEEEDKKYMVEKKAKMLLKGRVLTAAEYICGVGVGVRKKKEAKKDDKKEESKEKASLLSCFGKKAKNAAGESKDDGAAKAKDEAKKDELKPEEVKKEGEKEGEVKKEGEKEGEVKKEGEKEGEKKDDKDKK